MAQQMSPFSLIDPTIAGDQIGIDRQRALAQMLLQKGNEDIQQQVAGGYVVPISPWQTLGKAALMGAGGYANAKADQTQRDLALRQSKMLAQMLSGNAPTEEAAPAAMGIGSTQGDYGPTVTNAARMDSMSTPTSQGGGFGPQGMSPSQRLMAYSLDPSAYMSATLDAYKTPESVKTSRAYGVPDTTMGQGMVQEQTYKGLPQAAAEARTMGLLPGTPEFNAYVSTKVQPNGQAVRVNPDGTVSVPQGATNAVTQFTTASKQAEEGAKIIPVTLSNGKVDYMRQSDLIHNSNQTPSEADIVRKVSQSNTPIAIGADGKPIDISNRIDSGSFGQSTFAKKTAEDNATNMASYEKNLGDKVATGSDLNMRLQEQLDALSKFKAGGGGETRAKLASMAQAIGMPDSVVNGIGGGDLASMQIFKKNAAQTAMEQLKQAMNGSGRITQAEFKLFQENNPNLSTDPNAIKKIFDFQTKIFNRDMQEQQSYQDYKKDNPNDTSGFQANWAKQLQQRGFTDPNMNAQGYPGDHPMPPANGWSIKKIK